MRARELDKLLKRENVNLGFAQNRLERLKRDEDVTEYNNQKIIDMMEFNSFMKEKLGEGKKECESMISGPQNVGPPSSIITSDMKAL